MKKYFFFIIILFFSVLSIGQTTLKEKLDQVYSEKRVKHILEDRQKKKYFNNILFYSFELKTLSAKELKESSIPVVNSINMIDKTTKVKAKVDVNVVIQQIVEGKFNLLLTGIQRKMDKNIQFRLGNTNKILVIYSYKYLTEIQKKK